MLDLLWLIPALPLAGFLVLLFAGEKLGKSGVAWVGAGSVGISALIAGLLKWTFLTSPPEGHHFTQALWTWLDVGAFKPEIALYLDPLSLVMTLVVTGVGFLIHLYSVGYMHDDEDYSRFFACMNLFVFAMLILVLADNLLLLYVGWEGVGLCSYLLIGFWYKDPANCKAAQKAFIVTRVGDTAMALGFFLLVTQLGTLQVQDLLERAATRWEPGSGMALATALLLLGGAVGKSGQLPLQTWLPDAMAGPTPVSALIHAATMVTAGVYLIARTYVIYTLAPAAMAAVAVVGALTLLIAGLAAFAQSDIKRVLAYSTISQIGYMFLALGVGAWSAAMFHFMTHAFFKALLFLAAGSVIYALHHEQNIFKMGGIRKQLPLTYRTFLIGASSLAAIPFITSGFYSKDAILYQAFTSEHGHFLLWLAGALGALMTSAYTFRMVFIAFFGEPKTHVHHKPGWVMNFPLLALAFLSTVGGFIELPHFMGHAQFFADFMAPSFAHAAGHAAEAHHGAGLEIGLMVVAMALGLGGIAAAYVLFLAKPEIIEEKMKSEGNRKLHAFLFSGLGFDKLYDTLFVNPYCWIARVNKRDIVDLGYSF
ncbi:MAG: NADH-quinone oxidoreductase subunit L, partial [Candidatus Omnitrophica bacterium]|nr:NADH-quinone oxidoreductase subunit L [Candidatus Omnitrophota bacterium]